jgi:general secretion pathway protein A
VAAGAEPSMPGGMAGAALDVDLSHVQLGVDNAAAMSQQIAALTADQRGDQLQRLERSLLRLERTNLQILAMFQKLVDASQKKTNREGD